MSDFKGYLSDLGGPSANMYCMSGKDKQQCSRCKRPSCIYPKVCQNLNTDVTPMIQLYNKVDKIPGIKKSFIGSGVRYDLLMHRTGDKQMDNASEHYARELICNHVSGRLKVAPEHTSAEVLKLMRKPSFGCFYTFKTLFDKINVENKLKQQLIPYFISSHPGCTTEDMAQLAVETKRLDFHLEQVQDFTPTPMTASTEMYYTGIDPYSGKKVYVAKSPNEKELQRIFFFWYKPEMKIKIESLLKKLKRYDIINNLFR